MKKLTIHSIINCECHDAVEVHHANADNTLSLGT
jgi:hypothetical protein